MIWLHPRAMNMAEPTGRCLDPSKNFTSTMEVYIPVRKNTLNVQSVCQKILASGYQLDPHIKPVLADNHLSPEIIFPITYDGINTRTWGITTHHRAGIEAPWTPLHPVQPVVGRLSFTTSAGGKIPGWPYRHRYRLQSWVKLSNAKDVCARARIRILMQPILTILWQRVWKQQYLWRPSVFCQCQHRAMYFTPPFLRIRLPNWATNNNADGTQPNQWC